MLYHFPWKCWLSRQQLRSCKMLWSGALAQSLAPAPLPVKIEDTAESDFSFKKLSYAAVQERPYNSWEVELHSVVEETGGEGKVSFAIATMQGNITTSTVHPFLNRQETVQSSCKWNNHLRHSQTFLAPYMNSVNQWHGITMAAVPW